MSKLYVIGIGPGDEAGITLGAQRALEECGVLVGYHKYIGLIAGRYPDKPFLITSMTQEAQRCRMALERAAAGDTVGLVCGGDPGVYGMAGLVCELAPEYPGVQVEIIPGVTAATGGAAMLGAPLTHDFAAVSLSDRLTSWQTIEKRLRAAAEADFVLCLYNPASHARAGYLKRACELLLGYRAAGTVCGAVRNIARVGEEARIMTLGELVEFDADMSTTVFVGNTQTRVVGGRMVTPRGYAL